MRVLLLTMLAACNPLGNRAPILLSVNGVEWDAARGFQGDYDAFRYSAGIPLPIVVEAEDPEGDGLVGWWPWSPPGWEMDPDGLSGVWNVPNPLTIAPQGQLILQDLHADEPRTTTIYVPFLPVAGATPVDTGSPH